MSKAILDNNFSYRLKEAREHYLSSINKTFKLDSELRRNIVMATYFQNVLIRLMHTEESLVIAKEIPELILFSNPHELPDLWGLSKLIESNAAIIHMDNNINNSFNPIRFISLPINSDILYPTSENLFNPEIIRNLIRQLESYNFNELPIKSLISIKIKFDIETMEEKLSPN
ncbi:hypothetical protein [Aliamphritea spongicola]|nr:hypothetical protein [Aliamphritea spongicola]